ncbi:MAG TPA: ribonuclease Y [Solirubrobacterales bacterium]|nr:ribonuclease Y [Solirubrobacterales bacterium]
MEIRELLPFLSRGTAGEGEPDAEPSAEATAGRPAPAARDEAAAAEQPASDDPGLADELRARRAEIARMEEQALRNSESINVQLAELDRRRQALEDRERNLEQQLEELKRAKQVQRRELEQLSGLSAAQAKQLLVKEVEEEARHQAGLTIQRIEAETKQEAERRARNILAVAAQRLAATHASETTTRLVELPNDEMKGRIIGRDGRNIRALESLTGVDLIIDETPSAVILSSFDGVRREIARLTLEKLIADGRIHPALCEEMYEQARAEIEQQVIDEGERAVLEARVHALDPALTTLLGQLKFRTSYGQNVLDHLIECSHLAGAMAEELGASVETARRAALLHDIGKAVTHEVEGSHAVIGARMARRHGEDEAVAHAMEAHHNEVEPRTVEAVLVQAADALSGARPGARGESLEQYVTRLRDLEEIAQRNQGVHKVFAMRAGREIRVMVDPGEVDDERAALIAHEIATAVEREMEYPGRIKITVIRESRSTSFAS